MDWITTRQERGLEIGNSEVKEYVSILDCNRKWKSGQEWSGGLQQQCIRRVPHDVWRGELRLKRLGS